MCHFVVVLELQRKEMVKREDFVEESGPAVGDLGAEGSDTEEGIGGTDDSTYETEEEPTTETGSEEEVVLNTSQYKRLVSSIVEFFESETSLWCITV